MSIIVAPLSDPIRQRFGLLESVSVETIDRPSWQAGEPIVYFSEPCGPAECFSLSGCVDGVFESPYGVDGKPVSELGLGEACGLEVVFGSGCSARTLVDDMFDVRGTALRGLRVKAAHALESAIWAALGGDDSKLSCVPVVEDVCPDPVKPFQAIAAIENALAMCGQVGFIHVPVALLPHLGDVVSEVDGRLRTLGGSVVVAGQGYGDVDGDGSFTSIYGTGRLRLFAGEERFSPDVPESNRLAAVNAGQNRVEWRAEQSWAVGFDPCCGPFKASAKFC